jgi:hypothetical protein
MLIEIVQNYLVSCYLDLEGHRKLMNGGGSFRGCEGEERLVYRVGKDLRSNL